MKPETIARMTKWSDGGKGCITISAASIGPGWSVRAARKVVHGYGDIGRGSACVESSVDASAHVTDPSPAGLDAAINGAMDSCESAIGRWPIVRMVPNDPALTYDPAFGDDRACECGHAYYRHFDTYEAMAAVGCKYCRCQRFAEATPKKRILTARRKETP